MCGIAGWLDWELDLTLDRSIIEAMTAAIRPRGPDAGATWSERRCALGNRRLAVIDVEGGKQPVVVTRPGESRPCVLTYNGELYNFRELRSELEARGHRFESRSDSEVVLRAYLEWGATCAARFNGIFAFAIWDGAREELVLARDPLGVKPLLYAQQKTGIVFGSEAKALFAHPRIRPEIDDEGLAELLLFTMTPGHGVFHGISSVLPGTILRVTREGCHARRYWQLESAPHEDDAATSARRVRGLLEDIVERQLVSDVPLGTLLSGGLDSSAITALAAAARRGKPVTTFAIHFAGTEEHFQATAVRPEIDTPFARLVAEHVGTLHREVIVAKESAAAVDEETLRARDLPAFPDVNAAQYLLFQQARRECTVVLSGEGADEVFGGYPWFHDERALGSMTTFPWTLPLRENLAVFSPSLRQAIRPMEYIADRYSDALREMSPLEGEDPLDARRRELSYVNITRWLPLLLDFSDRLSMRVGLEVRVPFCDHRLVEYVWNAPWAIKAMGGGVKGLLREAVRDLLPAAVLDRKKTSFPISHDPAREDVIRTKMRAELADADSPLLPLIDSSQVEALLAAPVKPSMWRSTDMLAYLLQVAAWLRTYRVAIRTEG